MRTFDKKTFSRLLALVNAALWGKEIDENLFQNIDKEEWILTYDLSVIHGVFAVAFDGLSLLPKSLYPPVDIYLQWAYNTENLEKKNKHIYEIVNELQTLFKDNGLDVMFLKGVTLADNYPISTHREFGDIDLFLLNNQQKKGDVLLKKIGARKFKKSKKHSNFMYRNIMIENHFYFLDINDSKKIKRMNDELLAIVESSKDDLPYPPVDFSSIFFMAHAIKHLISESMVLRTCCDWVLFLNKNATQIGITKFEQILKEAGLYDTVKTINALSFEWLQPPIKSPIPLSPKLEIRLLIEKEMLEPFMKEEQMFRHNSKYKIFRYKLKKFHQMRKRSAYITERNFFTNYIQVLFNSIIYHIKNPQTIFTKK